MAIVKQGKADEQISVILLNVFHFGDGFNVNKMIASQENKLKVILEQRWATLLGSLATFETNLVYTN